MSLALRALPREHNELNVQRMLSYMTEAYWQFTPAPERRALAPRLESVLRAGLEAAGPQSLKSSWFSALARLRRDAGDGRVADARLETAGERCRIDACRRTTTSGWRRSWRSGDIPDADAVVDEQIARTKNPGPQSAIRIRSPCAVVGRAALVTRWFAILE